MQQGKLPPYSEVMERRRKSKAISWLCIIAVAIALVGVLWALS